ncbi:MAG: hypothetical protein AAF718_10525 [Pseudomonadota bacterium]
MNTNPIRPCLGRVDAEFYRESQSGDKISFSAPYSSAVTGKDLEAHEIWQAHRRELARLEQEAKDRLDVQREARKLALLSERGAISEIIVPHAEQTAPHPDARVRKDPEQSWRRQQYASALLPSGDEHRYIVIETKPNNRLKRYRSLDLALRKSGTYELGCRKYF